MDNKENKYIGKPEDLPKNTQETSPTPEKKFTPPPVVSREEPPKVEYKDTPQSDISLGNLCAGLQARDTNFVFLFGDPGCGKTAITSSICYHMRTDAKGGDLRVANKEFNQDGELLLQDIMDNMGNGIFMDRTKEGSVFEIDLTYKPTSTNKPDLNFTFIDMSGEDLKLILKDRKDLKNTGKFDNRIAKYLECPDINVTYLLVVEILSKFRDESQDEFNARERKHYEKSDALINAFLEYADERHRELNSNRPKPKYLLLISKWDQYRGRFKKQVDEEYENDIKGFVAQYLKQSNQTLLHLGGNTSYFTVGKVSNGTEILKFISDSSDKVKRWLYEAITGVPLPEKKPGGNGGSFFSRFFGK